MCPFQKGDRVIVNVDGSTFTGVVEVAVGFSRDGPRGVSHH